MVGAPVRAPYDQDHKRPVRARVRSRSSIPAKAALGDLKVGVEKAWGELRNALDSAITKFRESA
jgi:hypothetical protein